jgi:hypothetical protein
MPRPPLPRPAPATLGLGLIAPGLIVLAATAATRPAQAEAPIAALYEVHAAGLTVMRVEAMLDLGGSGYRVVTRARATGLASLFARGEQVTSAEGRWLGDRARPRQYRADGTWRGAKREVVMDYAPDGQPLLRALEPPERGEREPVPEALRLGTMDTLSALAQLARTVARTGRCEGVAATYDGRRRLDLTARTEGTDILAPQPGFPGGEALRCVLESRLLAGRRLDDDAATAMRPQQATAWLARVGGAGEALLPVRVEAPSRWFGTLRIQLVFQEPDGSGAQRAAGPGASWGRALRPAGDGGVLAATREQGLEQRR